MASEGNFENGIEPPKLPFEVSRRKGEWGGPVLKGKSDVVRRKRILDVVERKVEYLDRAMEGLYKDDTEGREVLYRVHSLVVDLLDELSARSTGSLSLASYNVLYRRVQPTLNTFSEYLSKLADTHPEALDALRGKTIGVHYVLPKMYVLRLVGSAIIRARGEALESVIEDVRRYSAGVQQSIRGVFLRGWLSQLISERDDKKDENTNLQSEKAGEGVGVKLKGLDSSEDFGGHKSVTQNGHDSNSPSTTLMDFLLNNFREMGILWRAIPEEERRNSGTDAYFLFAQNVTTISQLPNLTGSIYASRILPALAEEVIAMEESSLQECIIECILHEFSDDCQIHSVEQVLHLFGKLREGADVAKLSISNMDRLNQAIAASPERRLLADERDVFSLLQNQVPLVIEKRTDFFTLAAIFEVYLRILRFTLEMYSPETKQIDEVLGALVGMIAVYAEEQSLVEDVESSYVRQRNTRFQILRDHLCLAPGSTEEKLICLILTEPVQQLKKFSVVVDLENFAMLLSCLSRKTRRSISMSFFSEMEDYSPCVTDMEKLERLFELVVPLVPEGAAEDLNEDIDLPVRHLFFSALLKEEQEELIVEGESASAEPVTDKIPPELNAGNARLSRRTTTDDELIGSLLEEGAQNIRARVVFLLYNTEVSVQLRMYEQVRSRLFYGTNQWMTTTLPPLILCSLRLAIRSSTDQHDEGLAEEAIRFAQETIEWLEDVEPELALRLYLHSAQAASECQLPNVSIACGLIHCALTVYEEAVVSSFDRLCTLLMVMGTLIVCAKTVSAEDFDSLASILIRHGSRLLTNADQCVALCSAAEMFWSDEKANPEQVQWCLERATRAAKAEMSPAPRALLLTDVLVRASRLYANGCNVVGGANTLRLHDAIVDTLYSVSSNRDLRVQLAEQRLRRLEEFVANDSKTFSAFGLRISAPIQSDPTSSHIS